MTRILRPAIVFLLLTAASSAQSLVPLRASAGRWHVTCGSTSRSRGSIDRMHVRELAEAWTTRLGGRLVGEVLTWDDHAVALVRLDERSCRLLQIDLIDGRISAKSRKLMVTAEPEVAIWGRRAVVTLPNEGFLGFGLTRSLVTQKWRVEYDRSVGSPILLHDELYVLRGGRLCCYGWRSREPRWESGDHYVGRFAIMADEIFVLRDSFGSISLDVIDKATGTRLARHSIGTIDQREESCRPLVQLSNDRMFVSLPGHHPMTSGRSGNAAVFERKLVSGRSRLRMMRDITTMGPAILNGIDIVHRDPWGRWGDGWYGADEEFSPLLALRSRRPLMFEDLETALQTREHIWFGDLAVETTTFKIVRNREHRELTRPVPGLGMLLMQNPAADSITALRPPLDAPRAAAKMDVPAGRAFLRDDEIFAGRLVVDPEPGTVTRHDEKGRTKSAKLDDLLLLEGADGRILYFASEAALLRGLAMLGRQENARLALGFAERARAARSIDKLERALGKALDHGVDEKVMQPFYRDLQELKKESATADPELLEVAEKWIRNEMRLQGLSYWQRMVWLLEEDFEAAVRNLELTIEQYDGNEATIADMRAMIPEQIRPEGEFKPSEWFDFIVAARRRPIDVVLPQAEVEDRKEKARAGRSPAAKADEVQQALAAARKDWRDDLVGIVSENMLIITPVTNASGVAGSLMVGELVCGELTRLFGGVRKSRRRMVIHLFESAEEFAADSRRRGMPDPELVLGYYSPEENISRLYMPPVDILSVEVVEVVAHELTHHWMTSRSPVMTDEQAARHSALSPAFWVVEGLAVMMQELVYDQRRGEVRRDLQRSESLDVVANCPEHALVPWQALALANQLQFLRIIEDPAPISGLEISLTWRLFFKRSPSMANLFYAQAGALCHYLMNAEGGRHRARLIALIGAHYRGETGKWRSKTAFRSTEAELGEKVRAWAKERVAP